MSGPMTSEHGVEWRYVKVRHFAWWQTTIGPYTLRVENDYSWSVNGEESSEYAKGDPCASLDAAKSAAVAAAVELLLAAIASVPVEADWHICMDDPTHGMCIEAVNLERDNYGGALSLARALIAAALKARKEPR